MQVLIALRNALIIMALAWVGVTVGASEASKSQDCADATLCITRGHGLN